MGNCLVTKSVDNVRSTPRRDHNKHLDHEEAPKQLIVDMSKRKGNDHEEEDDSPAAGASKVPLVFYWLAD